MSLIKKLFGRRSEPPRKRSLTEKVDNIEEMVEELTDQLSDIHSDMWNKLAAIEEQANQRPSIVLGMPTENGAGILTLEPLEPLAELEPVEGQVSNDATDTE